MECIEAIIERDIKALKKKRTKAKKECLKSGNMRKVRLIDARIRKLHEMLDF